MKKFLNKILVSIVSLAFIFPWGNYALAQSADLSFDGTPEVLGSGGSYAIDFSLNLTGMTDYSYNGLKLIGVLDNDPIIVPFTVQGLYIGDAGSNGNIDTNMTVPESPAGKYIQVFLVDSDTFLAQGGAAAFNPESNSAYETFVASDILQLTPPNDGPPGGDDELPQDFDPEEDCFDILFADTPECVEFFDSAEAPYNPNFTLTTTLANPLGDGPDADVDIIAFLQSLFQVMVKISLPFLVLFTIYSGFLFVKARGNTDELEDAKKNFLYVIIGALIVFASWTIATVLKGTVDNLSAMSEIIKIIINVV